MTPGNIRFLLVDDVRSTTHLVRQMLRNIGATHIEAAHSVAEATDKLSEMPVDLIISDIDMPPYAEAGIDFLEAVRRGETAAPTTIKFALLTNLRTAELIQDAMALAVDAFILKPVSVSDLSQKIDTIITRPAKPLTLRQRPSKIATPQPPTAATTDDEDEKEYSLSDAFPDAILARAIFANNGRLLLAAGHVLTANNLDLLRQLASAKACSNTIFLK